MTPVAWFGLGLGFIVALIGPFFLRPFLKRIGVIDIPNERSSHKHPTIRGGGMGPLLGIVGGGAFVLAGLVGDESRLIFSVIICTAVLIGLVGSLEDVWGLSLAARASSQFVIGVISSWLLGVALGADPWLVMLATLFFVAYVNFANFMDGINGISGFQGVVVGVAYAVVGLLTGYTWLVASGLLIALSFGAFLPWNRMRLATFLGDVGSYLLGGAIASSLVAALFAGVPILTLLSPISIYLADTVSVLFRRASRREPVLRPHRTHTYQRLTDTGLSHVQVTTLVTSLSSVNAIFGILAMEGLMPLWAGIICITLVCTLYLFLPRIRGNSLPQRPVFSLGDIELPAAIGARDGFSPVRFAVLGASGFVGSAIVQHLRGDGCEVVELRSPRVVLSPNVQDPYQVVSLGESHHAVDELEASFIGIDVVINAAGISAPDDGPSPELYGANSLLPAIAAWAAERAGVKRVIHLSSAAVQGRKSMLDETLDATPFSPYSRSKALGERAFLTAHSKPSVDLIVIRATSVQGPGRATTKSLRWFAQSPLSSVANSGRQPTVVSSIDGLVDFVRNVANSQLVLAPIMLQPWEGFSVSDVLRFAGGKEPLVLPKSLCWVLITVARTLAIVIPEMSGSGRRLELAWLGQRQESVFTEDFPAVPRHHLETILGGVTQTQRNGRGRKS